MPGGGGYDCMPKVAPAFDPTLARLADQNAPLGVDLDPDLPGDVVQVYDSPHPPESWEYIRGSQPLPRVNLYRSGALPGNPDAEGMTIADMHKEIERRWARELRWNDAMERLLVECRLFLNNQINDYKGSDVKAERLVVMITEMLGDGPNMPAKVPAVTNGDRELSGVSG